MELHFIVAGLTIVLIDLLLGGDNAVVIALAVRALPPGQRRIGIAIGAGMAVALRIAITFFAAELLQREYIQLAGGLVILWIAVKLFADADPARETEASPGFWRAIWFIVIADITMSTDNVLAIAAASKGNLYLLIFGLGLSIPLVVFTSTLLSKLMDRYPAIVYVGAAILGRVGGDMIMTDAIVVRTLQPSAMLRYGVEAICAAAVVLVGALWSHRRRAGQKPKTPQAI
jgi:YjbE family integral membrane protein